MQYDTSYTGNGTLTLRPDGSSQATFAKLNLNLTPASVFRRDLNLDSTQGPVTLKNISSDLVTVINQITLTGLQGILDGGIGGMDLTGATIIGSYIARGKLLLPLPQGPLTIDQGIITLPPGIISEPITLEKEGILQTGNPSDMLTLTNLTFAGGNLGTGSFILGSNGMPATVTTTVDTTIKNVFTLNGSITFTTGMLTSPEPRLTLEKDLQGTGDVTINGPGTLVLWGENSYKGNTVISSGTLSLGGSLENSSVIIQKNGALNGVTTINKEVYNEGTISAVDPNGVPGILKIGSSYTQAESGTLRVFIGTFNQEILAGLLNVSGPVTLTPGSRINFSPAGSGLDYMDPNLEGKTFTILQSLGGINGTFTRGDVDETLPGFEFQLVGPKIISSAGNGQGFQVILHPSLKTDTSPSSVTLGTETNMQTTAVLSNRINRSQESGFSQAMNGLNNQAFTNGFGYNNRFYPSYTQPRQAQTSLFHRTGQRPLSPHGWESLFTLFEQGGDFDSDGHKSGGKDYDKSLWITPLYRQGKSKQTSLSGSSTDHIELLITGLQWQNPKDKHLFGVSLGGGVGETKSSVIQGNKSHHKSLQGAFYHSIRWDALRWDVFLNANRMFNRNDRVANVSTGYTIKSSNITDTLGASTEISFSHDLGDLVEVRPYYGLDYWYLIAHGYRENDNSIYSQTHSRMIGNGLDHYIGASIRKTWTNIGKYSLRLEGDLWYSYNLHDPKITDTITAVDGGGYVTSKAIAGYGRGTLSPSLTVSAMDQENGMKYFITASSTIQNKRTTYQGLCRLSIPLN